MQRENKRKKIQTNKLSLEEYLKQLPPTPEEHSQELKMEKYVKKLIEEKKKE